MDIKQYLDSTYLKTAAGAGLSEQENLEAAKATVAEAIQEGFKLVMIRPEVVKAAKEMVVNAGAGVLVGTVIDFPEGMGSLENKLAEAQQAVEDGADELDFVVNYTAFKAGDAAMVKEEVLACTRFALQQGKTAKWIIEVAALTDMEIIKISAMVKNVVISNFEEKDYNKVFVKSSTGFYKTEEGVPNGATLHAIKLILENCFPLPVKAAGGVRTFEEAQQMIQIGVKRIGTSSAKAIAEGGTAQGGY